ncbi:Aminopeptidase N [Echinococcus granulosus]|nr:Aminopeptidase N [Echinococcus granulosus]
MSVENKYSPGVAVAKPKKTLVIILAILLAVITALALIFFGTTLYFLLINKSGQGIDDAAAGVAAGEPPTPAGVAKANTTGWSTRVKDVRLPYTVIPLYYDLRLQANIYGSNASLFNFNGSVRVRLQCREATDFFFVHAYNEMTVNRKAIWLHREDSEVNLLANVSYDRARQWYRLSTSEKLEPEKIYLLYFGDFGAPLTINLRGWYLSSYVENNVTKYLATSQLQPTDARRVFPCWDEPAFKSIFEIKLVRREDFHSMSNMPLVESRLIGNGWVEDSFKPTLNTSTYLLAFVVSQFESLPGLDAKNRNFTIWARPDLMSAADYALDIGKKIIGFFEDYFELDYPLEKTDMLAVPHFAAGAMENWGLIIYREATLIWDPSSGTEFARQKVATVISHEIAHQWFGNLVTLDWWDDLWLNEGFATFVEYIGVAHAEPSWHMDEQFAVHQLQKVFFVDSLSTTHPVFLPVSHPDEINDIFDAISYNKGASVLRMMEAFLGREVFRQGLKIYLSRHKFQNTKPIDLWNALTEANSKSGNFIDVEAVMNVWIRQPGYPLVSVKRLGGNRFELSQERFLLGMHPANASVNINVTNKLWSIPITYATKSENITEAENRILWMNGKNLILEMDVSGGQWYALNLRQMGFYRVNYDMENWHLVTKALCTNHAELPRLMRAQLIDDSFHIANHGALSFEVFLNLTRYLRMEREYVPLNAMHRAFNYLYDVLAMHDSHSLLKRYVRILISDAYKDINWNAAKSDENHLNNMARQIIVSMSCGADHSDCVKRSKMLFDEFMQDPSSHKIPTSLTPTVYCTAIREGGVKEWDFLKQLSMRVLHEDEKYRILEALGCTRDFVRLRTYIRELIDDAISKSDDLELPASLSGNPIGLYVIYDTIKREWPNRNRGTNSPFKLILKAVEKRGIIIETLPIQDELMRMNATLHAEADPQTGRWIHRILTQSKRDYNWLKRYASTIHSWLKHEVESLQASSGEYDSTTVNPFHADTETTHTTLEDSAVSVSLGSLGYPQNTCLPIPKLTQSGLKQAIFLSCVILIECSFPKYGSPCGFLMPSRSSESARDCRKRKALRIQYLAESVRLRELTVLKMRQDVERRYVMKSTMVSFLRVLWLILAFSTSDGVSLMARNSASKIY